MDVGTVGGGHREARHAGKVGAEGVGKDSASDGAIGIPHLPLAGVAGHDFEGACAPAVGGRGIDHARPFHSPQDGVACRLCREGVRSWGGAGRCADEAGQHRSLPYADVAGRDAEIVSCGGVEAMVAVAEKHLVDVQLEDVVLGVPPVQAKGQGGFVDLSVEGAVVAGEPQLDELLGDGRAAFSNLPGLQVDPRGAGDAEEVDAGVIVEADVLGCQDGVHGVAWCVFDGQPSTPLGAELVEHLAVCIEKAHRSGWVPMFKPGQLDVEVGDHHLHHTDRPRADHRHEGEQTRRASDARSGPPCGQDLAGQHGAGGALAAVEGRQTHFATHHPDLVHHGVHAGAEQPEAHDDCGGLAGGGADPRHRIGRNGAVPRVRLDDFLLEGDGGLVDLDKLQHSGIVGRGLLQGHEPSVEVGPEDPRPRDQGSGLTVGAGIDVGQERLAGPGILQPPHRLRDGPGVLQLGGRWRTLGREGQRGDEGEDHGVGEGARGLGYRAGGTTRWRTAPRAPARHFPGCPVLLGGQVRYDHETVRKILQDCEQAGATDIHFKVPGRPRFRVDGRLVPSPYPELRPDDTRRIAQEVLALGKREIPLNTLEEFEFSFGVQRIGRFRAFLYRQRGSLALVLHRMAGAPPALTDLGADASLGTAVWEQPGLMLVCAQQQRLALMASLVRHYNIHDTGYLLVVEHPLEYLHADGSATVAQREVPHDTPTIASGMRFGLTGDCDAVVVSDLPDAETAELALQMAENGRRVVAAMVGCPWREAPRWFVRRFPQIREREITERLRRVLRQVVFEDSGRVGLAQSAPKAVAS